LFEKLNVNMAISMYELRRSFGKRVVGIVGGKVGNEGVDVILEELARIDRRHGTTSQVFDASRIAGKDHLLQAAQHSLIAEATGKRFASSLNIELACWVAAERQIVRAFGKVGVNTGTREIALLTLGKTRLAVKKSIGDFVHELNVVRDDAVVELTPEKIPTLLEIFSIPKSELKICDIQKLILERIALLRLQR
jgi:tRNA threonylcarbamoyladenosine modification (KEOPS) complex Cgi121 subunit